MAEPASVGGPEETDLEGARVLASLAIDAAGIGTFDWDLTSGRLLWDERLIQMFGYEPADLGRSRQAFNARLHPDDRTRVTETLQAAIDACGAYEADYRIVLPTGDTRWINARGQALPGADGTAARLIGVAHDGSAEVAGEARVTRILEAMPAGFYSLDPEWRFVHVNAEAERLLGHSRDELLGEVIWDAFPAAENSAFEESYRRAVTTGEPVSFDAYYPAPLDGWYELRAWPTPDGLSVYFIEVTARRLAQEQAERSARRLALLARVSAELASTLDAGAAVAELPRRRSRPAPTGCPTSSRPIPPRRDHRDAHRCSGGATSDRPALHLTWGPHSGTARTATTGAGSPVDHDRAGPLPVPARPAAAQLGRGAGRRRGAVPPGGVWTAARWASSPPAASRPRCCTTPSGTTSG